MGHDHDHISPAADRRYLIAAMSLLSVFLLGEVTVAILANSLALTWAPDGSRLAFVSDRDDHAFIGVYRDEQTPITWIAPSTSRDSSPRWSPDGTRLAFVRRPGRGGAPQPILEPRHQPWSLWTADAATGEGRVLWKAPDTRRGSFPTTHGNANLHWAARGRIVFLAYVDGWPHLYSMAETGGEPLLLTPGNYMAEYITLSPDGAHLVFAGNAGSTPDDLHRRHIVKIPVDRADPQVMTPGTGVEWPPVVTGDAAHLAFIVATAQQPPRPAVMPRGGGRITKFYHHWFASDAAILGLIKELGWSDQVLFPRPVTVMFHDGTFYAFDSAMAVLRFPGIPFIDRVRCGVMALYLRLTPRWQALEQVTADAWLRKWLGPRGYEKLWKPMLVGKFGEENLPIVNMAWFWARIHARTPRLGMFKGGFQAFMDKLADVVRAQGAEIQLNAPVTGITRCHADSCRSKPPAVSRPSTPSFPPVRRRLWHGWFPHCRPRTPTDCAPSSRWAPWCSCSR